MKECRVYKEGGLRSGPTTLWQHGWEASYSSSLIDNMGKGTPPSALLGDELKEGGARWPGKH